MKQLLEDYRRRLKTANEMLKNSLTKVEQERLKTKAGCYRTFIAELERELANS